MRNSYLLACSLISAVALFCNVVFSISSFNRYLNNNYSGAPRDEFVEMNVDLMIDAGRNNNAIIKSSTIHSHNISQGQYLMIPAQPDTLPNINILEATQSDFSRTDDDIFSTRKCRPTSQIRLLMGNTNGKWQIQSFDDNGVAKTVGGDEFYVEYYSNEYHYRDRTVPEKSADHPLAVGKIEDMGDGTYMIEFVSSPMAGVSLPPKVTTAGGYLKVHFVYTCGIGRIAPPDKLYWENSGFTQTSYSVRVDKPPPIREFQRPERVVNFDDFDRIVFVGDSLMEQFVACDADPKHPFYSRAYIQRKSRKRGRPLNNVTWDLFVKESILSVYRSKTILRKQRSHANNENLKFAVVMGSSTWDILADDASQGPLFLDHREAMRKVIEGVQERNPGVTLIWKSPTAVHQHVAIGEKATSYRVAKAAAARTKYMSSSRSAALYTYQEEICNELNIPFLDVYDAYYLSGDWHFPMDGRHYRGELNQLVFNYFVGKPEKVHADFRIPDYYARR